MERSLGGKVILEELRKAGLQVQPFSNWFRHDTPDEVWLPKVGRNGWVVLMRDKKIGKRPLQLDALLYGEVKAFTLVSGSQTGLESAQMVINALPKILTLIEENSYPFIGRIHRDGTAKIWKKDPMVHKGIKSKRHYE